jgi:hypothetical protein
MEVVYEGCCGRDLHQRPVVAGLMVPGPEGKLQKTLRTFGPMTADRLALADWLAQAGCPPVAMERSGVLGKPLSNRLAAQFPLLLGLAQQLKAVPGRPTEVKDREWSADRLRHGWLTPSFVPDGPQRELRELTRYRTPLGRERRAEIKRLQKTREGAPLELAAGASKLLGRSAREMLGALGAGTPEPRALAQLARGRLGEKRPPRAPALRGQFAAPQCCLVGQQRAHLDYRAAAGERLRAEISERLRPVQEELARRETIPGIARRGDSAGRERRRPGPLCRRGAARGLGREGPGAA